MIHDDSLGIPKVDVRSVGAGGGSIAFVDQGGLLQVGPRSAGARPGPACYGKGGTEPTVTDANVVLGVVDPDYFLGGKMRLDRALAEAAVAKVAERLGVSLQEAAYAIYTTSNHNMVAAIEEITVREGINPRDSFFVCGGGATAIHIAEMADILGLKRYMIPRRRRPCALFAVQLPGGCRRHRLEPGRLRRAAHRLVLVGFGADARGHVPGAVAQAWLTCCACKILPKDQARKVAKACLVHTEPDRL